MTVAPVTNVPMSGTTYVTELAARRAEWAATRQAAIAGNVANANTPRYKARDIEPFQVHNNRTRLEMHATDARHMAPTKVALRAESIDETRTWDVKHSANTVSLDQELMRADETGRHHQMAVTVMATFHRMKLAAVRFQ